MISLEQAKTATTHLTSDHLDGQHQKWYSCAEYDEIPIGMMFNVMKVNEGWIHYLIKEKDGRIHSYVKRADAESQYEVHFRESGMPATFKGKGLSSFDAMLYEDKLHAEKALRDAKGYVKKYERFASDGIGLLIFSKSEGSGKTHLAIAIVNELMKAYGMGARFVKSVLFFSEMKRNMGTEKYGDPCARSYFFDTIKNIPVLIMDDLGAGAQTSYTSDLVYELINSRVQLGKVTIYTSKRAFSDLAYDNSTLSLIQEKSIPISLPQENVGRQITANRTKTYEALLNS